MRAVNLTERKERLTQVKKIVWTFGLIAGAIMAGSFFIALPFHDAIGFEKGMVLGYTSMVAAFLLVYFGIRSYRDNIGGGVVGFGRAVAVGTLIVVVASSLYVAAWEAYYYTHGTDYIEKYQAHIIEKEKARGATHAELDKIVADNEKFVTLYENPVVNSALTFLEPLPVGILITLVSAGVLRRRKQDA